MPLPQVHEFFATSAKKSKNEKLTPHKALNVRANPANKYSHDDVNLLVTLVNNLELATRQPSSQAAREERLTQFHKLFSHIDAAKDNTKDPEKLAAIQPLLDKGRDLESTLISQTDEDENEDEHAQVRTAIYSPQ